MKDSIKQAIENLTERLIVINNSIEEIDNKLIDVIMECKFAKREIELLEDKFEEVSNGPEVTEEANAIKEKIEKLDSEFKNAHYQEKIDSMESKLNTLIELKTEITSDLKAFEEKLKEYEALEKAEANDKDEAETNDKDFEAKDNLDDYDYDKGE